MATSSVTINSETYTQIADVNVIGIVSAIDNIVFDVIFNPTLPNTTSRGVLVGANYIPTLIIDNHATDKVWAKIHSPGSITSGLISVSIGGSKGSDASATKQDEQTALLTTIANASLPDKETPNTLYRVKAGMSFTGASAGDPIIAILTIDTVTNTLVSNTPIWYNGRTKLPLVDADVDTSKLEIIAANSLTSAELSTMTLAISAAQIGEVQANPTANSVLGRLKELLTGIILSTGENHVGEVGGNAIKVDAVFTRPADTTAYTANDVVSNSTSTTTPALIQNIFRVASGSGYLTSIKVSTNKKSITPRIRVHLFNVNTATLAADNVAYKELYADYSKRVKYYDLPAMTTANDTTNSDMSRAILDNINSLVVAASASRDLYVVLETLDAFTPSSGQSFTVTLYMDNN